MIRYSGYPVQYQEILFDVPNALNNFVSVLLQAGWTYVRAQPNTDSAYPLGPGVMLQSQKTPQGLQCRLHIWMNQTDTRLFFRFLNTSETLRMRWPSVLQPRPTSRIRIIAQPFQFFTFKYQNIIEPANSIMGGVPYIPSFLAPFKIVSAVNQAGNKILLTLDSTHYYSGDLVFIDGAQGVTGLNGTFGATAVANNQLTIPGQISGTYVANSAVVAGPDRQSLMIWMQSTGYVVSGLFAGNCNTFRYRMDSAPKSSLALGIELNCNGAMINQYDWVNGNELAYRDSAGSVRGFKTVPYQYRWYDSSYIIHEPYLSYGLVSNTNESRVGAQLWDAAFINSNFTQLDKTISLDGKSWLVYTAGPGNDSPDGTLILRISN